MSESGETILYQKSNEMDEKKSDQVEDRSRPAVTLEISRDGLQMIVKTLFDAIIPGIAYREVTPFCRPEKDVTKGSERND